MSSSIERAVSPLARALVLEIQRDYERRIADAVHVAALDAHLPEGTSLDLQRMVWVIPDGSVT